jgi:hypothetical protein
MKGTPTMTAETVYISMILKDGEKTVVNRVTRTYYRVFLMYSSQKRGVDLMIMSKQQVA